MRRGSRCDEVLAARTEDVDAPSFSMCGGFAIPRFWSNRGCAPTELQVASKFWSPSSPLLHRGRVISMIATICKQAGCKSLHCLPPPPIFVCLLSRPLASKSYCSCVHAPPFKFRGTRDKYQPTTQPNWPTTQPASQPTSQPTSPPTSQPANQPTGRSACLLYTSPSPRDRG